MNLFEYAHAEKNTPLPFKARPQAYKDFIGIDELFNRYAFLKKDYLPSLLLWGPPGTGKTALAHLLAQEKKKNLFSFNAVLGNTKDLRAMIDQIKEEKKAGILQPVLFIDEIHRLHKAQQDGLLPYVESGEFILIGATTEKPQICLNKALLSRVKIIQVEKLTEAKLYAILQHSIEKFHLPLSLPVVQLIAESSDGDGRKALSVLENISQIPELRELGQQQKPGEKLDPELVARIKSMVLSEARDYDRHHNRHYDVISAFIKSMRGSDPNAALLWLAVMLEGGEDPVFIARRLMIFASEDIGNADPRALMLANAALLSIKEIGMPEARIVLAQATTYLASTVKSHASYLGINEAMEYVRNHKTLEVPEHLKANPSQFNKETPPYLYPHDYPQHFVPQEYTPFEIPQFYRPTEIGQEKFFRERLDLLWRKEKGQDKK